MDSIQINETSAEEQIHAQEPVYDRSESYLHMLNTVFMDIELGIKQLRQDGSIETAEELESEYLAVRERFADGRGPFEPGSPLHVVSVGFPPEDLTSPSKIPVIVTCSHEPVELLLSSNATVDWNVSCWPKVIVKRIYVVVPKGEKFSIAVDRNDIKVTEHHDWWFGEARPHARSNELLIGGVKRVTGAEPRTVQSSHWAYEKPWVIGKQSREWRAQMFLQEVEYLHARAMEPVRRKIFQLFSLTRTRMAANIEAEYGAYGYNPPRLIIGELKPPTKSFDFVNGVMKSDWELTDDHCFYLNSDETFSPETHCQPKAVFAGGKVFAVSVRGVLECSDGEAQLREPDDDLHFFPNDFDITFDSDREQLLVKGSSTLFSVDVVTGKWSGLTHLYRSAKDRGQPSSSMTMPALSAMSYDANSGKLLFLDSMETTPYAALLTWYSLDGVPERKQQLSSWVPVGQNGGFAFTAAFFVHPFLVLVSQVPEECPMDTLVIEDTWVIRAKRIDSRPYVWVIEPNSGRVLVCAPLIIGATPRVTNQRVTPVSSGGLIVLPDVVPNELQPTPGFDDLPELLQHGYRHTGKSEYEQRVKEIESGIEWLKNNGSLEQGLTFEHDLALLKTEADSNEYAPPESDVAELHVIGVQWGKAESEFGHNSTVAVHISYTASPVIVAVNQYSMYEVTYNFIVDSEVRLLQVIMCGQSREEAVHVNGLPSGVPVTFLYTEVAYAREDFGWTHFVDHIESIAGYPIATFIPDTSGDVFDISARNADWCLQHLTYRMTQLWKRATRERREYYESLLSNVTFKAGYPSGPPIHHLESGQMITPAALYEFDINGPLEGTKQKISGRFDDVVYDGSSETIYWIDKTLFRSTHPFVMAEEVEVPEEVEGYPVIWAMALDSAHRRLWLRIHEKIVTYDLVEQLFSLESNDSELRNSQGLALDEAELCLYALSDSGNLPDYATNLLKFDLSGKRIGEMSLSKPLFVVQVAGLPSVRLISCGKWLIAVINTSMSGLVDERPPRVLIHVIDSVSAEVVLTKIALLH